jgi:hypothetical protein
MLTSSQILLRILKALHRTPIRLIVFASLINVAIVAADFYGPKRIGPNGQEQPNDGRKRYQTEEPQPEGFWPFVFFQFDEISAPLVAIFNGLLVFVTYRLVSTTSQLWRTAAEQGRVAQDSINLARNEFNSTHRPKIRIKHLWLETDIWQDEPIIVTLVCVNTGPAVDAFLNEVGIVIHVGQDVRGRVEIGPLLAGHEERIYSGFNFQFPGINMGKLTPEDSRAIVQGVAKLYCLGYISYLIRPNESASLDSVEFLHSHQASCPKKGIAASASLTTQIMNMRISGKTAARGFPKKEKRWRPFSPVPARKLLTDLGSFSREQRGPWLMSEEVAKRAAKRGRHG